MENTISDLTCLFDEAKKRNEFEFVSALINYRSIGKLEEMTNLFEWFEAIEFYKKMYYEFSGKEKTRIGTLLYSTFFESSDFYNIIGSLCKIKLGYRASSYLFHKVLKSERLYGTGEKIGLLIELLSDCQKENIISFFNENHIKEIRNSFFHSAYSLVNEVYVLHDTDPFFIDGVGMTRFNVNTFLYPKIDNIICFFDAFKKLYFDSFNSYQEDKTVIALFPNPVNTTILGSKEGLKGYLIKNIVQFYGEMQDCGVFYDEQCQFWTCLNMRMSRPDLETIDINQQLLRYTNKEDITETALEFNNMIEKILERNIMEELFIGTELLRKFGNVRYQKMINETNEYKKKSFSKIILPYYKRAEILDSKILSLGMSKIDSDKRDSMKLAVASNRLSQTELKRRIQELESE